MFGRKRAKGADEVATRENGLPPNRIRLESGWTADLPSPQQIQACVAELAQGRSSWLILDRLTVPGGLTYAQAAILEDGRFVVEHQDGSVDRHYSTTVDQDLATQLLVAYSFELPRWDEGITWNHETW